MTARKYSFAAARVLLLSPICFSLAGAQPDAAVIMSKMAENIEKTTDARRQYVYEQLVRSSLVRSNGKISRWEKRTYAVLPGPEGTDKKMTSFSGEYRKDGKMYPNTEPGYRYKDIDIDGSFLSDVTSS